jgi:hypothetical protein
MIRPAFALMLALSIAAAAACGGSGGEDSADASDVASRYTLDPANVPVDLRPLVQMAERWGIGDDVERSDYIEQSAPAEREALRAALAPLQARITAWLDSFGTEPMSDEAAAFMYMQLAVEEMPD